jgi:hypothetical protein
LGWSSKRFNRRAPHFAYGEAESTTLRCASKLNEVGAGESPAIPPLGGNVMDWTIFSELIEENIETEANTLKEYVFDGIKEYLDRRVYFFLQQIYVSMDLDKDNLTLRVSHFDNKNYKDDKTVIFDIAGEIKEFDQSHYIERLKEIFLNSISLMDKRIEELKAEEEE